MTRSKKIVALVLALALASSSAIGLSVSAVDTTGSSTTANEQESEVGTVEILPSKTVANVSYTSESMVHSVQLYWVKPETKNVRFEVWRADGSAPKRSAYEQIADGVTTSYYTDTEELSGGKIYTYLVKPYIEESGVRTYGTSATVTRMTKGEAPNFILEKGSVVRSKATGNRPLATLRWSKPDYAVSDYNIYVNGKKTSKSRITDNVADDEMAYTVAFPSSGVFSVRVVAVTKVKGELFESLSYTKKFVVTAPPQDVELSGASKPTVSSPRNLVTWSISSLGVKGNAIDHSRLGFKVERAVLNEGVMSAYKDITSGLDIMIGSATYYFYDSNVEEGVTYSYRVTSYVTNKDKSFVKAWNAPSTVTIETTSSASVNTYIESVASDYSVQNRLYWSVDSGIKCMKIERAMVDDEGNQSEFEVLKGKFIASSTMTKGKKNYYYYLDKSELEGNTKYIYRCTPILDGKELNPVAIEIYSKPTAPKKLSSKPVFSQVENEDGKTANIEFTLKAQAGSVADLYEVSVSKTAKKFVHVTKDSYGKIKKLRVTASSDPSSESVADCTAVKLSSTSFKLVFTKGDKGFTIASDPVDNIFSIRVAPVNWWVNGDTVYDSAHKVYLSNNCVTYIDASYQLKSK